jgi:hypothetical protein
MQVTQLFVTILFNPTILSFRLMERILIRSSFNQKVEAGNLILYMCFRLEALFFVSK